MPDTLELIANALARQCIVTLRFDKYFTGRTGAGRYSGDPASTAYYEISWLSRRLA